jgi:hypothetical protein
LRRRLARESVEQAIVCGELQHALGFSPIAIGHDAVVESCDQWMLELNIRACRESLEWCHEAARAKVFEDMPKSYCLHVLSGSLVKQNFHKKTTNWGIPHHAVPRSPSRSSRR